MLRLLLQECKINFNDDDDDALDDSDHDEYIPDAMDDPDDQYDSEDLDAFLRTMTTIYQIMTTLYRILYQI
jgi:hypothetical protein